VSDTQEQEKYPYRQPADGEEKEPSYTPRNKKYALPKLPMPKDLSNKKPIEIYAMGREHGEQRVVDMLEFADRYTRMKRWFYLAIIAMNAVYIGVIIYLAIQLAMIPFFWKPI